MADARLPIMRAGIIPGERPVTPEASTAYRSLITVRPRLPPPTRGPVQAPGARSLTPYSRPPFCWMLAALRPHQQAPARLTTQEGRVEDATRTAAYS